MKAIKGPTSYAIVNGKNEKTVHINRFHKQIRVDVAPPVNASIPVWNPPTIEHEVIDDETDTTHSAVGDPQTTYITT